MPATVLCLVGIEKARVSFRFAGTKIEHDSRKDPGSPVEQDERKGSYGEPARAPLGYSCCLV